MVVLELAARLRVALPTSVALLGAVGWLAAAPLQAAVVNRIVATVDGEPITLYELQRFAEQSARLRQAPVVDEKEALEALITDRIIQKEVSDKGLIVADEEIDRYIEGIKQRNQLDDEQLAAALAQQGVSLEDYRAQIRQDLQKVYLINREIRGKVSVTPEEVERYYQAHLEEYTTDAQVTVSHILLRVPEDASSEQLQAVMKRAEELHGQLENGADFAELARRHSEDPAAQSGGRLGRFKKGEMLDELEEVVNGLETGRFSAPFRTALGVHIVRVDERKSEGRQSLDSLAEEIKEKLYGAALEERYNRWLREDLRKSHHVKVMY